MSIISILDSMMEPNQILQKYGNKSKLILETDLCNLLIQRRLSTENRREFRKDTTTDDYHLNIEY